MRSLPALFFVASILAACHGGGAGRSAVSVEPEAPQPVDSCLVRPPASESAKTLRLLVTEGIASSRPEEARTRGDRIIARQLYETLVHLRCDGQVDPALAESWSSADSGRIWTFRLRAGARFWDGTPLIAPQVAIAWSNGGTGEVPWAGIVRIQAVDEKQVAVFFADPSSELPSVLADPRLSVTLQARSSNRRPQGTGLYRISFEDSTTLIVDGWDSGVLRAKNLPSTIEFHWASGKAARDVVDAGIEVVVSDDKSLLEYAAARGHAIAELPWDRSYVLFVPETPGGSRPGDGPTTEFLDPMAREAVGVDARVSPRPPAWQSDSCGTGLGQEPDERLQPRRVVYPSVDPTARDLAHRLVTFAGVPGQGGEWLATAFRTPVGPATRSFPLAIGLEPAVWGSALMRGDELAYVFPISLHRYGKCTAQSKSLGWWMPLIETRPSAAIANGVGNLSVTWDGTLFVGTSR